MTEREEQQIIAGLKALARQGAGEQASPELEATLREAYRRGRASTRRRVWTLAAIAASLAVVAISMWLRQPASPPPMARQATGNVDQVERARDTAVASRPRPKVRRVNPAPRPRVVQEEIATGFMPVAGGDIFAPLDSGRVVRVRMPRSALAVFGLPVNEDRMADSIRADVLLGDDGMARAIRFVR